MALGVAPGAGVDVATGLAVGVGTALGTLVAAGAGVGVDLSVSVTCSSSGSASSIAAMAHTLKWSGKAINRPAGGGSDSYVTGKDCHSPVSSLYQSTPRRDVFPSTSASPSKSSGFEVLE